MKMIPKQLKDKWDAFKSILTNIQKLRATLQQLQVALRDSQKVTESLQRSFKRYQFKNAPHLTAINKIISKH